MVLWIIAPFLFLIAPKILAGWPLIMGLAVWRYRNFNQWPKWISGCVPLWFGLFGIVSIAWAAFPDLQLDFFMQRLLGLFVVAGMIVTLSVTPNNYFKSFHFMWRKIIPFVLVIFLIISINPYFNIEWADYNRMFVIIAILAIATMAFHMERDKNRNAIILYIMLCGVLFYSQATAALLVALLSLPLLYVVTKFERWARMLFMIMCPVIIVALPFAMPFIWESVQSIGILNNPSTGGRIEIWHGLSSIIVQNWGYGWGYDVTRFIELPISHVFIADEKTLHPHNMAIQVWVEFGVMGALGLAFVWFQLFRTATSPIMIVTLVGLFIIGSLSYGVWQNDWLGLCVFAYFYARSFQKLETIEFGIKAQ